MDTIKNSGSNLPLFDPLYRSPRCIVAIGLNRATVGHLRRDYLLDRHLIQCHNGRRLI